MRLTCFALKKALTEDAQQMSWKMALDTIDLRIGSCSHTESRSLRCWRGVMEKAYVDLRVNLLRCGPSLVVSLALLEDGRTEDSSFPNLLLHTEREPYGL